MNEQKKHLMEDLNAHFFAKYPQEVVNADDYDYFDKCYIIFNEFGPIALVFAGNEQEALDTAVDAGRLDSCKMSPEDHTEAETNGWDVTYLGNASEPFNLDYISMKECKVVRKMEIVDVISR